MSGNSGTLCGLLVEESFGGAVRTVAEELLRRGPATLADLVGGCRPARLALSAVQEALKILIQHCFVVTVPPVSDEGEDEDLQGPIKYKMLSERVLELVRYPAYFGLTESALGSAGREVIEEVVRAGCLPLSKLIYICGHRVKNNTKELDESALYEQIKLFRSTVQSLIQGKYLTICNIQMDFDKSPEAEAQHVARVNKEFLRIPQIDLNRICTKIMAEVAGVPEEGGDQAEGSQSKKIDSDEIDMETFTDADVLWTINVSQYHCEMRNAMVMESMDTKFKAMMVDTRVIKVLIDLGFEKYPWEKEGTPVSTPEIKDKIEKLPGGGLTSKFLNEHMDIVVDDPKMLVTRLSTNQAGIYSFNMKVTLEELMWSAVDKVIVERHGFLALRIFRLIKEKGYLEQDAINELGMIPAKDAKHLTYKLVEDHFIFMKEIRKSYAPSAPPGKVAHVFHIDINQVIRTLKESCFKAMVNLKLRIKAEEVKNRRLLDKEERINRILTNMTNKNCTEEQLEEIRELITPPEREVLMKFQFQTTKLISGVMHVDETLFLIQMYMLYTKRSIPTGKRKQ